MRIIIVLFICLFVTSLNAQSRLTKHPILKEKFQVTLMVNKNKSVRVIRFEAANGANQNVQLLHTGDMPLKNLQPGTKILGTFSFTSFASDGGLGTTRFLSGEGKGDLKVTNIILDDGADLYSKLAGVGDMAFRVH